MSEQDIDRRDPRSVAQAAELCAAEEDYDRLEEAGLLIVSLARQGRHRERQEDPA